MAGSHSQEPKFMALRTVYDLFQIIWAYSRTSYWLRFSRTGREFRLILARAVPENHSVLQIGFITKNNYTVQKNIRRVEFVSIKEKYFIRCMFR